MRAARSDEPTARPSRVRAHLFVAVVALAARALYLWQIRHAPFFELKFGDALVYDQWAQRIAGGDWLGEGAFYQAPLYPYLLALIYKLAGDGTMTLRVVQAVMGTASCVFMAEAARSLFGGRAGVIAGTILALYPPAIFMDGLIQKAALGTLLTTGLLALLCRQIARVTLRRWFWIGAVLGLLALTRENSLIFVLLIAGWLVVGHAGEAWSRRFVWLGLYVAGATLILAPIALRNLALDGELHLTTSQLGPNLYIGNNPEADGTYRPLRFGRGDARRERDDATQLAEQALGRELAPGEVSRYWIGRSLEYIRSQPTDWLALMARKLTLTFNAVELADTESQEVFAEWSWLLRGLRPFHFGLLLPLAVVGVVLTYHDWRKLWVFYSLGMGYAASVIAFYVFARYRFPLVPVLVLFAAAGAVELVEAIGASSRRRVGVALAAGLLAALFANLPRYDVAYHRAVHHFNVGASVHHDPARAELAIASYRKALSIAPDYPEAQLGLGALLARRGELEQAVALYRRAVELRPDFADAWYALGLAEAREGRPRLAVEHYDRALSLRPSYLDALVAAGTAWTDLREFDRAAEYHGRALSIDPDHVEAHVGMGVVMTRRGNPEMAIEPFQRAVELDPDHAVAHNNLGSVLATLGRVAEAETYFARAVELDPDYEEARGNLAQARAILARDPR